MLAATLLVGGTFLGTKALFTDKVDVASELAISTGDVDIEVVGTNDWVLDRNGKEFSGDRTTGITDEEREYNTGVTIEHGGGSNTQETGGDVFANNLKCGDRLYKEIIIQNQGTLIADTTIGDNFITEESDEEIVVGTQASPTADLPVGEAGANNAAGTATEGESVDSVAENVTAQ